MKRTAIKWLTCLFLISFIWNRPSSADEISAAIGEALAAYDEGDLTYAADSLEYALQLLLEKTSPDLANLLPEPLPGWHADFIVTTAVDENNRPLSVTRQYSNDGESLTIEISRDPDFVAEAVNTRTNSKRLKDLNRTLATIQEQPAMRSENGAIRMIVGEHTLVSITGSADAKDFSAYARVLDIEALSQTEDITDR
jgi:hypothetical protein